MRDGDTPSLPAGYHLDLISDPVASYPPNILPHQARSVASSRSAVLSVGTGWAGAISRFSRVW